MPINSRQKGARAEREVRDFFKAQGYTSARRGQQFAGGADSPDVIVPELPWLHVESKMVEALNIYNAMRQSIKDSNCANVPGKIPTVFHRRNNEEWHVTLRQADFFQLVKHYQECILKNVHGLQPKHTLLTPDDIDALSIQESRIAEKLSSSSLSSSENNAAVATPNPSAGKPAQHD